MLKAGPKIHGDGANLNFGNHLLRSVGQIYGQANIQMQGTIAVIIGRLNIILTPDKLDIRLPRHHIGDSVNIVDITADHPDPGDIVYVPLGSFDGQGLPFFRSFAAMLGKNLTRPSIW